MNRHRVYWSVMGIEPGTYRQEMIENLEKELNRLADIYGLDEIITTFRKMKLEQVKED
ncbi:hypothetical protein [Alkaliphilus sp. B6464]|uniref:hypothetical protein n=1 Tax=Alkaliphilus sp. B6464 TaxID=2731219 RepID=UPI001BAD682B|nr:hypothetical protein [Alkaliphilus sp. B6464]QUH21435.1 hypothetical protein HYG84_17135 [Alkaliphilus sp. B6464]